MPPSDQQLIPIDIRNASLEQYTLLQAFHNRLQVERLPDDPLVSLDEYIRRAQNMPVSLKMRVAVVYNADNTIIGQVSTWISPGENRQHILGCDIGVLPEYRRQGIGRRLLTFVAEEARRRDCYLIVGQTYSNASAGEAFAERVGARRGLESCTSQLIVAEVDRDLLRRWQEQVQERAAGFVLGFWDGPYPEEDLAAFTELINQAMSDAPRDSLEMANPHWTPEQLREFEAATFAAGKQRWVAHVRDKSSGSFAGYTVISWHPNRPHIVDQGDTAVSPGFRNTGLGRWLKAAMLERLIRERPQVKFVRTGNANSNAPILRINRELGFRPYSTKCRWQVETERVEHYLERLATSFYYNEISRNMSFLRLAQDRSE